MLFELSKILWWFFQPTRLWLILVLLGVVLLYIGRQNVARGLLTFAVISAFFSMFFPVHSWIAGPLENRFSRLTELPLKVDGILVLGGAVDELITASTGQPALNHAAERMTEAVALARRYPTAKLVFSGGSSLVSQTDLSNSITEADVAKLLFDNLHIYPLRLFFERASRNTWENVVNTKALMNPQEGETWILVTSAYHMPRSVGIFRKVGWNVIPYPTDYRTIPGSRQPNIGFSEKLYIIDQTAKEWVGLVSYYLLGRTSAVFPAP